MGLGACVTTLTPWGASAGHRPSSGLAFLRNAGWLATGIRWCRRCAPQPPANGFEPSGFGTTPLRASGRTQCGAGSGHPGGMPAISRGVSEARAIPPVSSRKRHDPGRGRSRAGTRATSCGRCQCDRGWWRGSLSFGHLGDGDAAAGPFHAGAAVAGLVGIPAVGGFFVDNRGTGRAGLSRRERSNGRRCTPTGL